MPLAAAAAADPAGTAAEDVNASAAAVLAIPDLVVHICRRLDFAADGAHLRQACKQTASSLDWFDLMWCARQDLRKVHRAITQHDSVVVSSSRVSIALAGSRVSDVWSWPPLMKWVVLQAAKQGDADLLGIVLDKGQQKANQPRRPQQQQQQQDQTPQEDTQQQQQQQEQEQNQAPVDFKGINHLHKIALGTNTCLSKELGYPSPRYRPWIKTWTRDPLIWLAGLAAEAAVCAGHLQLLKQMVQNGCLPPPHADEDTVVKQHLTPALVAAAAADDVEAMKVLLSYCPDLLDYALAHELLPFRRHDGTYELVRLLGLLHEDGFTGIKVQDETKEKLLVDLCSRNQSR